MYTNWQSNRNEKDARKAGQHVENIPSGNGENTSIKSEEEVSSLHFESNLIFSHKLLVAYTLQQICFTLFINLTKIPTMNSANFYQKIVL